MYEAPVLLARAELLADTTPVSRWSVHGSCGNVALQH